MAVRPIDVIRIDDSLCPNGARTTVLWEGKMSMKVRSSVRTAASIFAFSLTVTLFSSATVGASAASSVRQAAAHATFVGTRGPLAVQGSGAQTAPSTRAPGIGDVLGGPEIKSPDTGTSKDGPQGGSAVLTGNVRPPSAGSLPVSQNPAGVHG